MVKSGLIFKIQGLTNLIIVLLKSVFLNAKREDPVAEVLVIAGKRHLGDE
jgi:hypothetical protein